MFNIANSLYLQCSSSCRRNQSSRGKNGSESKVWHKHYYEYYSCLLWMNLLIIALVKRLVVTSGKQHKQTSKKPITVFVLISMFITPMFVPGPHFIEYLGYEVTPECCVVLKCKVRQHFKDPSWCTLLKKYCARLHLSTFSCCVAFQVGNVKKETSAVWYKDGREIKADEHLGFTEGVLKLEIAQVRTWEEKRVWSLNLCQ